MNELNVTTTDSNELNVPVSRLYSSVHCSYCCKSSLPKDLCRRGGVTGRRNEALK